MKRALAVFVLMAVAIALADNPHITNLFELHDVAISSPANGDTLTYNSATAKWENKPAVAGPKIIGRIDLPGLTTRASSQLLLNPSEAAIYRITSTTQAPTNTGTPIVYDANFTGLSSASGVSGGLNGLSQIQKEYIIRLDVGQQLFYDTTSIGTGSVDVYFVIEKL